MLVRAGLLSQANPRGPGPTMTTVMQRSARLKKAWRELVRGLDQVLPPGRERPNSVVSYYQKGPGPRWRWICDRGESGGRRCLDDVMRWLWPQWRLAGPSYRGSRKRNRRCSHAARPGWTWAGPAGMDRRHARSGLFDVAAGVGIRLEPQLALDSPHFALLD